MKNLQVPWSNNRPSRKELRSTILRSLEPKSTREATERAIKILDSKYEKADLNKIVDSAENLNQTQKQMLLQLLKQYEALFDGTLGRWRTTPVKIEL